jgi:hypothetical protein
MKIVYIIFLVFCFSISSVLSQQSMTASNEAKEIDQLIGRLKGLRFNNDIKDASNGLSSYQQLALPKLISLLYDPTRLDTDPGDPYTVLATGNYNGYNKIAIIPYNFDWLSIRAGYVIESMTFIDFGYSSSIKITDNKNGNIKLTWNKIATAESLKKDRKNLADKVTNWWQINKATWSRFNALKTALQSKDKAYVTRGVDFIYYGETKCDGFTKERFEKELKPLLKALLNTTDKELKNKLEHIFEYGPSDDLVPRN